MVSNIKTREVKKILKILKNRLNYGLSIDYYHALDKCDIQGVIMALQEQVGVLCRSLQFYANKDNYVPTPAETIIDVLCAPLGLAETNRFPLVKKDEGKIARETLAIIDKEKII